MTVYVIAQLTITTPALYRRYLDQFFDVFARYEGTLLVADSTPDVIEGQWNHDKIVLMSFPDRDAFDSWANSAEYQEIARDRRAGTRSVVTLARSVGSDT